MNTYEMWKHNGWGDSIYWLKSPSGELGIGRLTGHLSSSPDPGDEVHCKMKSGKIGVFLVLPGGNYPMDPPDQFFVDAQFDRYLAE